ncbi:hypothetical protein Q5530_31480 [Saccharothrix sp. BKS2]|uniref:hypothetical protein n=1 Tax=Saccharothrix sp. BKS2 TaxID=3064400 RepID=UPI0039E76AA2
MSYFQLERWRAAGLVPRNVRRGLGRGRGTVSVVLPEALPLLLAVAKNTRQGRKLPGGGPLERVIKGLAVPDAVVRAAAARQMRRLARSFAPEGIGEAQWQRRDARARANAGTGLGQGLNGLLDDSDDEDVPTRPEWKDAAAAFAHIWAGDVDGATGEDLVRGMMVATGRPEVEVEQALAEVRAQEMAGVDLVELLVPRMSLRRTLDDLAEVDLALFKRALTAMGMIQAGHGALTLQALHTVVRREIGPTELDSLMPESLQRVPEGVDELRAHPAWAWLSRMMPTSRYWLAETVLVTMVALRDPAILAELEDYRDRLVATVLSPPAPA